MSNNKSNSLIDFHHLAIELRRLKKYAYAIPTAAMLINQSITKEIDYSALLQCPESKSLSNLCVIICNRFSKDPSSDILTLIPLIKFSSPRQQIGPWFLLNTLLSNYHYRLTEECFQNLSKFDPMFFEKYLLGRVYSNPKSLFRSTSTELLLPLEIPNLANLAYRERNNPTLIQYLIYYCFSRSGQHVLECAQNEQLFESFSNFVFKCPQFFIVANQLFDDKSLFNVLQTLKNKNPSDLLNSYLPIYKETSHSLIELFFNLYNEQELLQYVSENNIKKLYHFLQSNDRWDIISHLFHRDQISNTILTTIFTNSFHKDPFKYLSRYSQLKHDFLIEVIESFLLSDENQLDPKYFVYLLPNDRICLRMLERNPSFLQIVIETTSRKDEVKEKTVKNIVSFISRNIEVFLAIYNNDLHGLLFDENSVVSTIIRTDEIYFFDIFGCDQKSPQLLTQATIHFVSFITQTMAHGMGAAEAANGPMPPQMAPHDPRNLVKFPSNQFFKEMVKRIDLPTVLLEINRGNNELMSIREWRDALVAVPELLFATLGFAKQFPEIAQNGQYFDLFISYVNYNYDTFSRSVDAFLLLVDFFLDAHLMAVIPMYHITQLSLSVQLAVLDSFSACAHLIFADPQKVDHKVIKKMIDFFKQLQTTDVFGLDSPSNGRLCKDFVLPLFEYNGYEKEATEMMIHLNTSPQQQLTATSTFSEAPQIENLDIDFSPDVDDESLHFIIDFLRASMPDEGVMQQLAATDRVTLGKFVELSMKVLAHADCPLWLDPQFMRRFISGAACMQKQLRLTPGFVQSLAQMMERVRYGAVAGGADEHAGAEIHPELVNIYQVLMQMTINCSDFENVLDVLL